MGLRGRQCSVCANPEAALKCDSLIASGIPLGEIAAALGVSKFCVSRHKRHSALKFNDTEAKQLPEDRLETLYDRCDQLFQSLAGAGDAKAAADILKIQARLAEQAVQRAEAKQEAAVSTDDNDHWPTSQQFDNVLKKVREFRTRSLTSGMIQCSVCEGRGIITVNNPDQEAQNADRAAQ